jgi:ribosomal protein S18 acetylase RimI-like enzyme
MILSDVPNVSRLHMEVFPDYFLTHLGFNFLVLFYQEFTKPGCYAVVAYAGPKCIGFITGTSAPEQLFHTFYHNRFMSIGWIVIKRVFVDSFLRSEIIKRLAHFRTAIFARLTPNTGQAKHHDKTDLMSIGVSENYRGMDVAEQLLGVFLSLLAQDEIRYVSLTVRSSNPRAIRFYEKTGWKVEETTSDSIIFYRNLSTKDFANKKIGSPLCLK